MAAARRRAALLAGLIALCPAVPKGKPSRETRLTDADLERLDAQLDEEDEREAAATRPTADARARAEMVFAMLHYRGMDRRASERLASQWSVQLQTTGISAGAHTISAQRLLFTLNDGRYVRELVEFLREQPQTAAVMHDGVEQLGPADSVAYREEIAAQSRAAVADAERAPRPRPPSAVEGASGSKSNGGGAEDLRAQPPKRRRRRSSTERAAHGKDEV
jgi:hypothetical protein